MKKEQIVVGGHYTAKVSNVITTVRVDSINERANGGGRMETHYNVTNLRTGRTTRFRSAAKFRGVTSDKPQSKVVKCGKIEPGGTYGCTRPADHAGLCNGDNPETNHHFTGEPKPPEGDDRSDPTPVGSTVANVLVSSQVSAAGATSSPTSGLAARLAQRTAERDDAPHVIVIARAGSGKTTTLVEGLKRVRGIPSTLVPSPQQAAVWDAMELSRGKVQTILFCAFNKSIAEELKRRIPVGCEASTMHSLGFRAVNRAFGRVQVNQYRVSNMVVELAGQFPNDPRQSFRDLCDRKPGLVAAVESLVGLCKMNLVDPADTDALNELVSYYDIETNGNHAEALDLTQRVIELCKDVRRDNCIDYDDMIWLPIALDLPCQQYDLLLYDELQDANKCQHALAFKSGRRIIGCGDPKQAIYGFAGAAAGSMKLFADQLKETPRGCVELPLTVTRRCGKAIVREANKIVLDFDAHESNPEGLIRESVYPSKTLPYERSFMAEVRDGDMVLCRCNAPLVTTAFKFIKAGRKANIQGRNIGAGLTTLVKKLKAATVTDLSGKLDDWYTAETAKENAKRNPSENKLVNLEDKYECVSAFLDGARSVDEVLAKIDAVFTDDKDKPGIRLSSGHKAKGLEAHRVYILQLKKASVPHPMAKQDWAVDGEWCLLYVMITRARDELVYVREA